MSLRLKPLSQQTIVITGASSGIGLATTRMAARAGARVFLISRNGDALATLCQGLTDKGHEAAFAVADVGDEGQLAAAAAAALARFGSFDSWINVAGVAIYAPLLDTPTSEHARLFQTNYWGVVNAAQVAIPVLSRTGGAFVTVGSIASDMGAPVLGAYTASKHAVKGYIDSLRIELLGAGAPVSVTLIKPSGIGTPLAENAANHMGVAARVPPPAYAPEVVARTILAVVQNPRREITVGGVGFLQIMIATHAPGLYDRVARFAPPFLKDDQRPANLDDNLEAPNPGGRTRSAHEPAKPFSLFTGAILHPWLALGVVAAGGLLAFGRQRRSTRRIAAATFRPASLGAVATRLRFRR